MKMLSIVGARPNFMKVAPFLRQPGIEHVLVHTGQHYSLEMSGQFFSELGIKPPDYNLDVKGSQGQQIGRAISRLEPVLEKEKPDWVVLYGDVNAVCSGAIMATRLGIPVAHVEAGLRSGDWSMPEEQNRVIADMLSQRHFVESEGDFDNLRQEAIEPWKAVIVGNIMIDTLEYEREAASQLSVNDIMEEEVGEFAVMTLHRPSNVDNPERLRRILEEVRDSDAPRVIFPVHPRTWEVLTKFKILEDFQAGVLERMGLGFRTIGPAPRISFISPVSYREMLKLNMEARMFITDSGGLQEECCVLGTPCVVVRDTTERPVTLFQNDGTCLLTGSCPGGVKEWVNEAVNMERKPKIPPLWDGKTAERIARNLLS